MKIDENFKNFAIGKGISLSRVAGEVIENSPTVQSVANGYSSMTKGLKVLGYGLFGMFVIRQFTK